MFETSISQRQISVDAQPLDKVQVKALREADSVTFFHNPYGSVAEGQSRAGMIRVTKTIRTPDGWASDRASEASMEIPVLSRITYWGVSWASGDEREGAATKETHPTAVSSHSFSSTDRIWRTVAKLLKAGDVLTLYFEADIYGGQSPLRRGGMTMDRLTLNVKRTGQPDMDFLVDTWAGEQNSLARMVRKQLW